MLDQRHTGLPKSANDPNTYTLGCIHTHNIVIACLPKGKIGNNSAATVAAHMIRAFPCIKIGLMVGIGGGVPPKVRLGDVVVSTPVDQFPGVIQWDFGKTEKEGTFKRTGALNNPPSVLLTALGRLESEHEMNGSAIPQILDNLEANWPRLVPRYLRSDSHQDILFRQRYHHVDKKDSPHHAGQKREFACLEDEEEDMLDCRFCDQAQTVTRKPRDMRIHYGLVASGNQVVKDAYLRDKLNAEFGGNILCFEMEAAGLMTDFPCLVIRGICDYTDSHKNKTWQEHAAAVAAAFAKELLNIIPAHDIEVAPMAIKAMNHG